MDAGTGVYILSENRLLREALSRILKKRPEFWVLHGSCFSAELEAEIINSGVQVLLLDSISQFMGDESSIRALRAEIPTLKIVLMGMEPDEQTFLQTVRRGAAAYLLKDASAAEVVTAIRAVTNGEAVCPPKLCRALFDYLAQQTSPLPSGKTCSELGLTRREQQLLPLLAGGLRNKEIASRLNVSEQTVKNHVHRILRKVGVENRLAVADVCREQGLIL